jgi:two-component system alkaline phosphatase synthesis response regulator PhoP
MSKVKALLRRRQLLTSNQVLSNISENSIVINKEAYLVYKNKEEIFLPKKEFEILSFIASKPNRLFSREEIFNHIWGNDAVVGDRTIDVHIRKIRSKIGDEYIRTVKGLGYKFVQH